MIHRLGKEQIAETRGIESECLYLSTSIKTLTDDDDDGNKQRKWALCKSQTVHVISNVVNVIIFLEQQLKEETDICVSWAVNKWRDRLI